MHHQVEHQTILNSAHSGELRVLFCSHNSDYLPT